MISKSLDVKSLPAADSFNVRVASFRAAGSAAAPRGTAPGRGPSGVRSGRTRQRPSGHSRAILSWAEIAGVQARLARIHTGNDVFVEAFGAVRGANGAADPGGLWRGRRGLRDDLALESQSC